MNSFDGRVWRHVPAGRDPLHVGALWKHSHGRWNRQGEYAALYTACTPAGARAEWERLVRNAGSAVGPRDLVSIDVVVSPVCDLTIAETYAALAQRAGMAPHPRFLDDLEHVPHSHCQALADQARAERYPALLVPSAAARGEINLIVYFDIVAPKNLQLDNGPDRSSL